MTEPNPTWIVEIIVPGISALAGFIGCYAGLLARSVSAEAKEAIANVRTDMATMESRIVETMMARINGTYVRRTECGVIETSVQRSNEQTTHRHDEQIASLRTDLNGVVMKQENVRERLAVLEAKKER